MSSEGLICNFSNIITSFRFIIVLSDTTESMRAEKRSAPSYFFFLQDPDINGRKQ